MSSDRCDGRGHVDAEAQTHRQSKCGSSPGEAQNLFRPAGGSLVQSPLLPPEPFPQLHRGQRGKTTVFSEEVLPRRPLLHRVLRRPDVPGGKTLPRPSGNSFNRQKRPFG